MALYVLKLCLRCADSRVGSGFGFCGVTSEFCGKGCEPNSKGDGCGQLE